MRVLVACEESGTVRDAFARLGHEAWSADIQESRTAGNHYLGNVLDIIDENWDLMIAHPPCTYLCVPGAHYLNTRKDRCFDMNLARDFFIKLQNANIKKICIENPVPHSFANLPKYNQIIHPWQFGHEFSKRTCLWLKNLPKLIPTDIKENKGERYYRADGSSSNSKWYAGATAKERSKTFQGIADAMAIQWGNL